MLAVATFILARMLAPDQFGLMSMALLVITAFDILRDFGIGSALITGRRTGRPPPMSPSCSAPASA